MPQETKSQVPADPETLQGWNPALAGEAEVRQVLEKAFDYRGDVTVTLTDGRTVEGYIFDRDSTGKSLAECHVRMFPKDCAEKVAIAYSDIAAIAFTGRDTAAGKSFRTWIKKYTERKLAGEKNISLEPEKL